MKAFFSTFDIVNIFKETKDPIPRERLREWMQRRFIKPKTPAKGVGYAALFTLLGVYAIALFNILLRRGFNRKVAAELIEKLTSYVDLSDTKDSGVVYFPSILIFFVKENGKKLISFIPIYAGEHQIKLPSGKVQCITPVGVKDYERIDGTPIKDNDWDQIEVINFTKTRAEIDEAVKKL
jgi:hypothetical protein